MSGSAPRRSRSSTKHRRVAAHLRIRRKGGYATEPVAHAGSPPRLHAEWTPSRLRPHPEQGYRSCLGLMKLHARLLRRTPGGRLPPRTGHRHAELRIRQVHPRGPAWTRPATTRNTRSPCPQSTPTSAGRSTTPFSPNGKESVTLSASPTHPRPAPRTPALGHGPGLRGADSHARHQRAVLRGPPLPPPRTREDGPGTAPLPGVSKATPNSTSTPPSNDASTSRLPAGWTAPS